MLKKFSPLAVFILLLLTVWYLFNYSMPSYSEDADAPETAFSTSRAFELVEKMSTAPHFVGSPAHSRVRNYIVDELQKMGLEVQTQAGYSLNRNGALSYARNILARIPGDGTGKSLVLMSHYDSAGHSSYGASDAASGVATILEGIRAFLATGESHFNDIILLFTDVEEVGLLGAQLFVREHPWAANAGLALNFEARGSGGNSFMLLETNSGNAGLIKEFKGAAPAYPATNSLAYSVYKMLPNDTDLTVLREQGDINGFNFAFIDDHYDYHTANDIPANLDKETLAHQGSYLMPLLNYFKDADLTALDAEEDLIYFSVPPGELITYPFSWIMPMLLLATVLFLLVVGYGIAKKKISPAGILKGAVPYLISVAGGALLVYLLWQFVLFIYPEYREMEHGFTYNGYYYITSAIFIALTLCFLAYNSFGKTNTAANNFVFPLLFWLLLCALMALYLPGAAYFIIPFYFGLVQLWVMIRQKRPNLFLMFLLGLPALIILMPFVVTFTVALGLKIVFVSALITAFLFSLFLPVFLFFKRKKAMALLCFLVFNAAFITAHFKSSFTEDRQKPNSLVYLYNADEQTASWNSYDRLVDDWTKVYFGEDPVIITEAEEFSSKYGSGFTFKTKAPVVELAEPGIIMRREGEDSLSGTHRYSLKIVPNRKVHRMELYAPRELNFEQFRVNRLEADSVYLGANQFHIHSKRWHNRLLTYHVANRDTLSIEFSLDSEKTPEFTLYESSYDLLENSDLGVKPREKYMMPRPFVLNDAVIVKKEIRFEQVD
ncbi:M28 family peptidase [Antarcticibacterium flavum]|uniref:Vacuolar membrane protease n=1 Tax=Antarcticibacterium flavum TaxID=2058175 RepID=A0A5B7X3N4_9FLAO|nr:MULTISPECIES: M28 family peptidase [Antarcticibacterium]MCM4161452.1 peptidase M28 [Antarcticibacterium sp. W02-3]QCY69311.1 M28 family peptidase [Antarcticibacterium flavum]